MAQQLWLLRHGEAEPHDAAPDEERKLTKRGEDQSRAAGAALARLDMHFHLVFTSPKVRALDTARLACEALGAEPVVHQALADGLDMREALELASMAGDDQRVLVVGHNPDFEQVIYDLTGGRVELKKGGIAGIRVRSGGGELLSVLRPREIGRLAAG